MTQLKSSPNSNLSSEKTDELSSRVSPWLARLLYPLGCHIVIPGFFGKIEITGQENIPLQDPVIIAPTHRSRWDAVIVPYAVGRLVSGRDLRFMVSADEMRGIQGWFVRRFGGFAVDTRRPTVTSLRHGVELLQKGEVLVIFPEGNIFRQRQIQPLKPGLARLAIQAEADRPGLGVQVVPIVVDYSQTMPGWGCNVRIGVAPPLSVSRYCQGPNKQGALKLTADLEAALKAVLTEIGFYDPRASIKPPR